MRKEDAARAFWNRVDNLWGGNPLKELAERSCVDYVLLLNWRTKHRFPDVTSACNIANTLETTVNFLVFGAIEKAEGSNYIDITNELKNASGQDLELIRRILRIEKPVSDKRKEA